MWSTTLLWLCAFIGGLIKKKKLMFRVVMRAISTEEEEDAFLNHLIDEERQEKAHLRQWHAPLRPFIEDDDDDDEESRSSSDEIEEVEEMDECEYSRAFIEFLSFSHANASPFELANLLSAPSSGRVKKVRKREERPIGALDDFLSLYEEKRQLCVPRLRATTKDVIDDEERKRIKYTVVCTESNVEVEVMVENHVYVTYFRNKFTKEDYTINLSELATLLLRYGVQYSDNKFTKVTLKYTYGPSHYFFRSGAMVESGTYNPIIARKSHNMSMNILYEVCGYDNIEIKERKCHNIVAKGTLKFGVRLLLLLQQYPTIVQYDDEKFAGAIIRLNKVHTFRERLQKRKKPRKIHKKKCRIDSSLLDTYATANISSSSSSSSSDDDNESSYSANSGSSSSSGEYEYFEEGNDDRRYNENFEYFEVDEAELDARRRESESHSTHKMVQKKALKKKDLLQMHPNAYDLNQYERDALMKKKNVTILVFEKGRMICAGCRNTRNVLKAIGVVTPMIALCRDTPHNQKLEQMNTQTMGNMIEKLRQKTSTDDDNKLPEKKAKRTKKKKIVENDRDLFESFKKQKVTK
jgi:TATA-box binding protein (TBP) (component of TFIID and TFIIIB)